MRHFEMKDGGTAKFLEIDLDGATVTVRFGRLGTDGQTKAKGDDSNALRRWRGH